MPVDVGDGQAVLLYENRQAYLFQADAVNPGTKSIRFQLRRTRGAAYPNGASFQIGFNVNPGVFQVDIQTSDQDIDAEFVTLNSVTGGLNSSWQTRLELPSFWAKYTRAVLVKLTNPALTTVLVSR